ncbi:hypothetical protein [Paenibacillus sp. DMB20]|nr:hypothetical protein [Paenibacillus sp. DMB20]
MIKFEVEASVTVQQMQELTALLEERLEQQQPDIINGNGRKRIGP